MSAGLPDAAKAELYAARCSGVWLHLVTIEHDDFAQTLRYVDGGQDVTSGGDLYTAMAFAARLPQDKDGPVSAILVLDNVDRAMVAAVRAITTPGTVTIEVIRQSAPDTILRTFPFLRLVGTRITATSIEFELAPDPVLDEGYPGESFTPLVFPAGFDR